MTVLLILAGILLIVTAVLAKRRGMEGLQEGGTTSYRLVRNVAPMIALGMLLAGMTEVVLPTDVVNEWMGSGSGFRGLLVATIAGAVIPGGPYVMLPLAGSAIVAGAGAGPMAAFVTSWSVIPLHRTVVFELPFLAAPFTFSRFLVNLPYPFVVGLLTPPVFRFFSQL